MNELYFKLKHNVGLTLILIIGLGVELSNFQSMFYRFMTQYRPDWGAVNHIPAGCLSAFLLLCIVIFGIRKQVFTSWFLALLTCVVSFAVYSRMNLSWQWESMHEVHFVVIILSTTLPMLVAYTTHQISNDREAEFLLQESQIRRMVMARPQRLYARQQEMHRERTQNPKSKKASGKKAYIIDEYDDREEENDREEDYEEEVNIEFKNSKKTAETPTQHCKNCFVTFKTKNPYAQFCSDECRLMAVRRKRNSDFYTLRDDFEIGGSMEWVNPQFK
jgi:predicted nucleic acid-binding Zn ribbon protein